MAEIKTPGIGELIDRRGRGVHNVEPSFGGLKSTANSRNNPTDGNCFLPVFLTPGRKRSNLPYSGERDAAMTVFSRNGVKRKRIQLDSGMRKTLYIIFHHSVSGVVLPAIFLPLI